MLGFIISLIIIGALAGFIGRFLVPGPDPMSIPVTIGVGIIGSFLGGFIGWALFGKDLSDGALQPSGIIGSIIGAVLVVLAYRALSRRDRPINRSH
ncbi:MAG: GlsB/YeaQ/YmgE family stress response membrane protein [Acidimicrobiia bacterium]